MEADESIFGSKDENMFKRILMFIPRLISKVITVIQRAISKKIHGEVFTDIDFNMIDVYIGKIDSLLYDVLAYIGSDCTKVPSSLQDGTIQTTIEELNKLSQSPDNFKQDTRTKVNLSYYDMKKTFKYISKKMSGNAKHIEKFRDSLNKEGSISDDKIFTDVKKLLDAIIKFYQVIYKICSEPKNHLITRKQSIGSRRPHLTKEFYDAVKSGNVRRVRIMMKDSLLVDPTFEQFHDMEKIASSMDGLYDEHDGEELTKDRNQWDVDYMNRVMVSVVSNFSHERLDHLKEVVRYLRPVSEDDSSENK